MATSVLKRGIPNLRNIWRTCLHLNYSNSGNIDLSKCVRLTESPSLNFTTAARLLCKNGHQDQDEFSGKQDEATEIDMQNLQSEDDGGFSVEKLKQALHRQEHEQIDLLREQKDDKPYERLGNPYQKVARKCYLCEYNVKLDYKNTQLLNQFISPHTGRIYNNSVTGLCYPMQRRIVILIKRARRFGFMPTMYRELTYMGDPIPFKNPYHIPMAREDSPDGPSEIKDADDRETHARMNNIDMNELLK